MRVCEVRKLKIPNGAGLFCISITWEPSTLKDIRMVLLSASIHQQQQRMAVT